MFVTVILHWARCITSEAIKFFINPPSGNLLDLRGMERMQKESEISECNSGGKNNDDSKNVKVEKRKGIQPPTPSRVLSYS